MKDCIRIKTLLSRYLDKEASFSENLLVGEHLKSCAACQKELSEISLVKEAIRSKKKKILPEDFLVSRLREEIARESQPVGDRLSWLIEMGNFSRRLIPVPAVAVVLLLAAFFLLPAQSGERYSIEEHLLNGNQFTTGHALSLILGAQD